MKRFVISRGLVRETVDRAGHRSGETIGTVTVDMGHTACPVPFLRAGIYSKGCATVASSGRSANQSNAGICLAPTSAADGLWKNGRGGEIRTRDLYVPNVALYQAKLRPDYFSRREPP